MLQMRPRGDFGHHTAKGRVFLQLAEDGLGQDGAIRAQNSGSGFIAATFDSKDDGIGIHDAADTMPLQIREAALPATLSQP
jgi:hypothetical protein